MYEALQPDGANTWQRFRYITWPQLQPTTFFVTIILTINCFKVYDIVYMLAGGNTGVLNESAIAGLPHLRGGVPQLEPGLRQRGVHGTVPNRSGDHPGAV